MFWKRVRLFGTIVVLLIAGMLLYFGSCNKPTAQYFTPDSQVAEPEPGGAAPAPVQPAGPSPNQAEQEAMKNLKLN